MMTRLRRVSLVVGLTLFGAAFGLGLTQSLLSGGTLPSLSGDVLATAKTVLEAGDTDGAVAQLRTYAHLEPGRAENWISLGEVLARLDRPLEATAALERVLELPITSGSTTQGATLARLATIYYESGRVENARERGRQALQAGAELPPTLVKALGLDAEQP